MLWYLLDIFYYAIFVFNLCLVPRVTHRSGRIMPRWLLLFEPWSNCKGLLSYSIYCAEVGASKVSDLIIPGGNVRTIRLCEAVVSLLVPYWLSCYLCGPIRGHHTNLPLVSCQTGTIISLTLNLVKLWQKKFLHVSSANAYRCDGFQS